MSDNDRPPRLPRLLLSLTAAVLLCVAAIGFHLWGEHDPFWDRTAEYREVNGLAATIHKRPLTDAEFGRALQLCETGNAQARTGGMSVVEESVRRDPERAGLAAEVLARVSQTRDAKLKANAERLLKQFKNPPAPR